MCLFHIYVLPANLNDVRSSDLLDMGINWARLGRFAFYSKRRALLEEDQLELFEGREHCLVVLYLQMEDAAMP